jgi:hypothetical protein
MGLSTLSAAAFDAATFGKPSVLQTAGTLRLVFVTLSFGHDRFLFLVLRGDESVWVNHRDIFTAFLLE